MLASLCVSLSGCTPGPTTSAAPTGSPAPSTAGPPTIAPSSAATPASSPVPSETSTAGAFTHWQLLDIPEPLPHVDGGSDVRAAAALGDGFVAIGGVNGGCCDGSFSTDTHGVVWRSSDGITWTLAPRATAFDLARPVGLASNGHRLVVIGTTTTDGNGQAIDHGAAWASDDGLAWQRVQDVPIFTAVVAGPHGFVAASDASGGPELWASADGLQWSVLVGASALGQGSIRAMAVTPAGIVAVGSGSPGGASTTVAAAWRSTDGAQWTRASGQPWFSNASMDEIAVCGTSIVTMGNDLATGPAMWRSDDGLTWARALGAPLADSPASTWGIAASSRGFVLVGKIDGNVPGRVAWQSVDGVSWAALATPDGLGVDRLVGVEAGADLVIFTRVFDDHLGRAVPEAWSLR